MMGVEKLKETNEVRRIPRDFFEEQARQWDLRYGGMNKEKNWWRLMAVICITITAVTVFGYISTVSKGKYIPYIVEVDKLGKAVSYKPADRIKELDNRIIEATLARFIYCLRTVSIDKRTLKMNMDSLYSFLNTNDPAYSKITTHLGNKKNNPYQRAKKIVTSIEIRSIMKLPSGEWVIKWREDVFTRKGKLISSVSGNYQAIINLMIVPSSIDNESEMNLLNPVGIYIRDMNWQKEI